MGGTLIKWEPDAQNALKRWDTAWIGMTQDTASTTYDEPFNGWFFSDGTPMVSVPWANGEPNNGVQPNADTRPQRNTTPSSGPPRHR